LGRENEFKFKRGRGRSIRENFGVDNWAKKPEVGEEENKNALLGCVWVHPKTTSTASSLISALVVAGSL